MDEMNAAASWDAEYARGRYIGDPLVPFVWNIIEAARRLDASPVRGLYIGCGNGRNYIPLIAAGLDVVGIDISQRAIDQLAARLPHPRSDLICSDVMALPAHSQFDVVIGIQVFQHGTAEESHAHFRKAMALIAPGGLFCVRVNAVGTHVEHRHTVLKSSRESGFTIRYEDGPKRGLAIHFFARSEIEALTRSLVPLTPLSIQRTRRPIPRAGHWDQWEGIWQKSAP